MPSAEHRQQLAAELLRRGELTVTAIGGSMAPTLAIGERVRVRPDPVRSGDVALFRTPSVPGYLLHRVIARLPGGLLIHAGDCPGARAGLARTSTVLGRADLTRVRPRLRSVLRALLALAIG